MEAEKTYNLDMVSVRLVHDPPLLSDHKIKTAEDAVQVIGELLGEMDREVICIINLKSDGTPINGHIASVGAISQAVTTPREMLKAAILSNAASMIMLHCHPSGSVIPSMDDVQMTARMIEIGNLVGIPRSTLFPYTTLFRSLLEEIQKSILACVAKGCCRFRTKVIQRIIVCLNLKVRTKK